MHGAQLRVARHGLGQVLARAIDDHRQAPGQPLLDLDADAVMEPVAVPVQRQAAERLAAPELIRGQRNGGLVGIGLAGDIAMRDDDAVVRPEAFAQRAQQRVLAAAGRPHQVEQAVSVGRAMCVHASRYAAPAPSVVLPLKP
ncbi:hypothetical protein D3C72_1956920 [compost metagenome]